MVIWKGLGILVGIAGFVGFILAEALMRVLLKSDTYYHTHVWPKLIGALIGAGLAYGMCKILEKGAKPRIVIDKESGREIELRREDSLFFVPAKFWPYLILIIGTVVAFIPA